MGATQALDARDVPTMLGEPLVGGREVDSLREENKQLRELVIQLSRIVLRNAMQSH